MIIFPSKWLNRALINQFVNGYFPLGDNIPCFIFGQCSYDLPWVLMSIVQKILELEGTAKKILPLGKQSIFISTLHMRQFSSRVTEWLAQSHTIRKRQRKDRAGSLSSVGSRTHLSFALPMPESRKKYFSFLWVYGLPFPEFLPSLL